MSDNFTNAINWLVILVPTAIALVIAILLAVLMYRYRESVADGIGSVLRAIAIAIKTVAVAIWNNYTGVITFVKTKMFTRAAYFRYGILVCMIASIIHGSHLFVTSENIPVLNLLTAATFDIGIWVFIESMIYVRKRGYIIASLCIVLIVAALSIVSFTANVVYNTQFYNASAFSAFGLNAKNYIVMLQSSPPLVIIVMTIVAEIFTKSNVKEEVTLEQRLQKRSQRRIAKIEAKLKLHHDIVETKQRYAIEPVQRQQKVQQEIRWSFLGLKMYNTSPVVPPVHPETIDMLQDTLQKITVTIVSVQQSLNQVPHVVQSTVQSHMSDLEDSMKLLSQSVQQRPVQQVTSTIVESDEIVPTPINMHMHNGTNFTPMHVVDNQIEDTTLAENTHVARDTTPVTNPQIDTSVLRLASIYPGIGTWITEGRTTAPITDVIQIIGIPMKDVKKMVKDGTIEVSPLKPDMIRLPSLYTWLKQTTMVDSIQSR